MPSKLTKTSLETKPSLLKALRPGVLLQSLKKIITLPSSKKRKKIAKEPFFRTLHELKHSSHYMSEEEKGIFTNFLQFGKKTISKIMIPRSDICAITINTPLEELHRKVAKNSHTRTLVYEDTLDNIVGFVHIKDLYLSIANKQEFNLRKLLRMPIMAAPSMKLVDLLAEMQKRRTHIAIVLDEYGGTAGIVTIEDIMEEIVGRIEDEHDKEIEPKGNYKLLTPNSLISNARVDIEEVENALGIKLRAEEDEAETIGGLILARAGYVPKIGAIIKINERTIAEIIDADARSLKSVKLAVEEID